MTDDLGFDVSRETSDRFELFAELVKKWNPKINLVSRTSLEELWTRHILDSLQIYQAVDDPRGHWVDIGSGGGFPGLIVAIMAKENNGIERLTLVESDQRKCAFLRTALRELECSGVVVCDRIENLPPLDADILSARALSDLTALLEHAERHLSAEGLCVFAKGATWQKELKNAQTKWRFGCQIVNSVTNTAAATLKISGVSRV